MKDIIKKMLYICGYYRFLGLLRVRPEKTLIILMYHDIVADDKGPDNLFDRARMTRSEFAAHLRVIKERFRVISVEDAINELKSIGHFKEDSVAITFDDGYSSVYNIAFPLLKQYGFPATVYLTTDWINKKISVWWEELANIINSVEFEEIRPKDLEELLGIRYSKSILKSSGGSDIRGSIYEETSVFLSGIDDNERRALMDVLRKLVPADREQYSASPNPLSWEEIVEMAEESINFGAHTCTHINVRYASLKMIERELSCSKEEIERRIKRRVGGFVFPYGKDLPAYLRLEPLLNQLGFDYACTTYPGNNNLSTHRFRLRRISLPHTTSSLLLKRYLWLSIIADKRAQDG